MEAHVREWKIRRALIQGTLRGDHDDVKALRAEAAAARSAGFGWHVDGFEGVAPEEILRELDGIGIGMTEAKFKEVAQEAPGPHEIAEMWSAGANLSDERHQDLPWLAARALWACWLPETLSLETASDSLESTIATFEEGKTRRSGDGALVVFRMLIEIGEGEPEVVSAIADEIPFRLWAWVLEILRDTREGEDFAAWKECVESLIPLFPSEPVLRLLHARFLANNGVGEGARAEITLALTGRPPESYHLSHAAEAHLALGDGAEAMRHAENALLIAEDESDEEEATNILGRALESLDRSAEHASRVEAVIAQRRRDALARRKKRRKQDRKKGKKRG